MRDGILLVFSILVILAISGCVSDSGQVSIKFDDLNLSGETLSLNYTVTVNGTDVSDNEDASNGTSAADNVTGDDSSDGSGGSDHDPCSSIICDDTVTTCPDGDVVTCTNVCDDITGICSSCVPGCAGHEEESCDKTCGTCQTLDEEECICETELFCEGNGICTSDEWPDGEDCLIFDGCDDGDQGTMDSFDPNIQECVHTDACDDDDPCTDGAFNVTSESCEFVWSCCGNGLCDEPGDLDDCPGECEEFDGESGDVMIASIDPDGNETVVIEGSFIDLTGWTIEDDKGTSYTFPDGFVIDGTLMLHTIGCPDDNNETDLYWGTKEGGCRVGGWVWNDHDNATLRDPSGEIIDTYDY